MSHVTDVILSVNINANIDELNDYLIENHSVFLNQVDGNSGGNKVMQCDVYMAAINYLNIGEFISVFNEIDWDYPECAQLMIKDENDDAFLLFNATLDKPNNNA